MAVVTLFFFYHFFLFLFSLLFLLLRFVVLLLLLCLVLVCMFGLVDFGDCGINDGDMGMVLLLQCHCLVVVVLSKPNC